MAIHYTKYDRTVRVGQNGMGDVLLTVNDETDQAKAILTPKQAMGIIVDMLEQLEKIEQNERANSE